MERYEVGQQAWMTKTISESDVYIFAGITGDLNPAHINEVYAQKTQFVIITHRKSTMECCDTLYGVTMQEKGVSKMLRVKMSDIIEQEVS